jgi:hypothetical protein
MVRRCLMTLSTSARKIILCSFSQSVLDLVYHQYGICRMYSKEKLQDFRLFISGFYAINAYTFIKLKINNQCSVKLIKS